MDITSPLQRLRMHYNPELPLILQEMSSLLPVKEAAEEIVRETELEGMFPNSCTKAILRFRQGASIPGVPLRVGIILSGGQAPGGHNVIAGLFDSLKKFHPDSRLIGFFDGPDGIIHNRSLELTKAVIAPYRNLGGFDVIGSGRGKIETAEQFEKVGQTLLAHRLDGLVIVGGDDSNTNAAFLAEFCHQRQLQTRIVGVPKTIDGDLKNAFVEVSFGFDTATKVYSEIIGNLLKDALSAKKYYFFIKMMGRSASHVTLECALQTQPNLALIGEEVEAERKTLATLVEQIADLIGARAKIGKEFGAILIPEGLLEFIPECREMIRELNVLLASHPSLGEFEKSGMNAALKTVTEQLSASAVACWNCLPESIQRQLLLDRDPHGNVQVSQIETERLLIELVEKELRRRKQQGLYEGKFNPQPLFCGYEGRSGFPSNFDCRYCYALGHAAALLIRHHASGYMCCIKKLTRPVAEWEVLGVPLVDMLHFELRKNKKQAVLKKTLVDLNGAAFASFKQQRASWELEDVYRCPGPIQFEGHSEGIDQPPLTLLYEFE